MKKLQSIVSSATLSSFRVSPRKARLVADLVRGELAGEALRKLQFCDKKSAPVISKLILSAVANAKEEDSSIDVDNLYVSNITVDMGRTMKRFLPRAQGRASHIRKRSSKIIVSLGY